MPLPPAVPVPPAVPLPPPVPDRWHRPPLHTNPVSHFMHALPAEPHAVAVVCITQVPVLSQHVLHVAAEHGGVLLQETATAARAATAIARRRARMAAHPSLSWPHMKGITTRRRSRGADTADDRVAVEEPLEIRVAQDTLAITMRTPGDDVRLALGFLLAEGLIKSAADVGTAAYCGRPGDEGYGNIIEVTPASGAVIHLEKLDRTRRGTLTTSACGVCGRRSIDDLLALAGQVATGPPLKAELVARAPELLRHVQPNFALTGGVHAAAVLASDGSILSSAEDVGRHNAVDKAIGALVQTARAPAKRGDGEPAVLLVSGRASFEIVQKAAMAKLAAVVSVSAASSLAIDLADRLGLTLAAFTRGGEFNLYAHPERLQS